MSDNNEAQDQSDNSISHQGVEESDSSEDEVSIMISYKV